MKPVKAYVRVSTNYPGQKNATELQTEQYRRLTDAVGREEFINLMKQKSRMEGGVERNIYAGPEKNC